MGPTIIPVLRIFDLDKAREFYCGFLEWKVDWDKNYKYSKPSAEAMPWKTKELRIHDPFGNKPMFYEESGT